MHSNLRTPLTAALITASLLIAPVAFAGQDGHGDHGYQHPTTHHGKHWKPWWHWKPGKGHGHHHPPVGPPPAPPAVPEFDAREGASAAALLGGAFLLLVTRRRPLIAVQQSGSP
jgi:hypothetical protein